MAIGYVEVRIVSAGRGESVVGLGYYICRQDGTNPVDGRTFRFAQDAADLASLDVLLPPGAPLAYRDPAQLCAAMELRETTIDRKTGRPRFKISGQIAKHIILALPKELTPAEQRRLACDWAGTHYVKHGVGAIVAVHHPDDPATGNGHAHIIVTTRVVSKSGLGKKARHLNPAFTRAKGHARGTVHADGLPGQWAAFQDSWFRKHGIELRVDPFQGRGGVHLGRALYLPKTDADAANKAAFEESKKLIQDPAEALATLTKRKPTFSRPEIASLFRRFKFTKDEIKQLTDRVLAHPELVRLHDSETGAPLPRFTTRQVRAQERRILDAADTLLASEPVHARRSAIAAAAQAKIAAMGLAPEQAAGLLHLIDGPNLRLLRGIAGAGKSYTIRAVREALEAGGFRVIGLAPTNTVSCSMAVDGFTQASTVDLELIRQEAGRFGTEPWDRDTCIVIDEAAMLDAGRYERILVRAAATGARVILVGDEKQLASVERGGIFDELKARYGCAELLDVRRQNEGWAKAASRNFAAGRIRAGIEAYASRGHMHWSDGLNEAMTALVARWGADVRRDPSGSRFAYAATNKTVDALNAALQNERWHGQQVAFERFETKRGDSTLVIDLVVGDRIQLHGTDRKLGLYNGVVGTVTFASQEQIHFTTDDGQQLELDPRTYDTWALGYAGTAYRGQGKTQTQVYALYDHPLAWHARTSYVAFTRHRQSMDLFVPRELASDLDALVRQMSRSDETRASVALLDDAEATQLRRKIAGQSRKVQARVHTKAAPVDSEISVAKAPLARRRHSSRPFRITLAGQSISYNIADLSERVALVNALRTAAMEDVVAIHRKLPGSGVGNRDEALEDLRTRLASMAKDRGLHIMTRRPHPDSLSDFRNGDEPLHQDPTLAPAPGEPDFRPMLQSSSAFSVEHARRARDKLRGFDGVALAALCSAGWSAWSRTGTNEQLRYPVIIAMAFLQSWTWRWRERLGFDVVAPQPPGIYRKHSLALFEKARRTFRAFDPVGLDEPGLDQASLATPTVTSARVPEPEKPQAAAIPAPPPSPWEVQQRAQAAKAAKRQGLEARRSELQRQCSTATGDQRIALTIELAEVSVALDNLERGFGAVLPAVPTMPTSPAISTTDVRAGSPAQDDPGLPRRPQEASDHRRSQLADVPASSTRRHPGAPTRMTNSEAVPEASVPSRQTRDDELSP